MNAIRSIAAGKSHRLPARLKLLSTRLGSLILLFQRMPVVQFLFPEANIIGGASVANTISLAVTTVVGLGVFDSVAGQSQISQRTPLVVLGKEPATATATAATAINVPATVSASLNFGFNWDPNNDFSRVKSWRCTTGGNPGTLPAGLSPASDDNTAVLPGVTVGVGTIIPITGTPSAPGIYPVTVRVYKDNNYGGEVAAQIFNICVLGFSGQPTATPASISSGQTSSLTCTAAGNPAAIPIVGSGPPAAQPAGTLTYQWYRGLTGDISNPVGTPNATTPGFTTPTLTATTDYWVRIKSVLGASTVTADSNTVTVTVTPVSSPFETWASVLPEGQRGANQTPQNDGVTNLEKFAFNLNPLAPDVRHLTVGANETAGLPGGIYTGGKLRLEFLRRRADAIPNPGISYTVQFGSDLSPAGWTEIPAGTPPGVAIDATWERVTVDDPDGGTKRFGRVKVVQTP
jgi:hypothetical protein